MVLNVIAVLSNYQQLIFFKSEISSLYICTMIGF